MAGRPRLLFLAQSLPYPPHAGVAVRTFNILKELRAAYDIDLVAFYRSNHHRDDQALAAAREALGHVARFVAEPSPIPNEQSALRKVWDHARSVVSGRVYTYYEYDSRDFQQHLRAVLRARTPDLVHLDSLDLHRWLAELPPVPIACTHHDIDSELLRLRAQRVDRTIVRSYLNLQAARSERAARRLCPRFAVNVMMSEVDAGRLRSLVPGAATTVVPNGTDTEYFRPNGTAPVAGRVVFVGPTYSFPNRDAVEFLLADIWPRIHAVDRATSLRLIGRNSATDQVRYAAESGVTPLGYVTDVRPGLADASCCVVPIRVGGGTRLKILDAWAMGKAVVSTSIGCEGLDAVDGENILIRDTPDAFADAVLQVLKDERLRAHLERHARNTAVATYSWNAVGGTIRSAYDQLLGRGQRPPAVQPRSRSRCLITNLGALVLGVTLTALSCGAPADSSESQTVIGPPLKEPPGLVTFNDQPWNDLTRPSTSILNRLQSFLRRPPEKKTDWSFLRRTSSKDDDIVRDVDAPRSPPNVLRIIYTPDMARDAEPSVHWIALPGVREVYTAWWMKLSPNWHPNPAGGGKITFLWTTPNGAGQVYTNLYHQGGNEVTGWVPGPPYRIGVNTEWAPYAQKIWLPNVATTFVNPGEWHRLEFYYRWGTAGDGIIQWWVDGVLNGDYRTVIYPIIGLGFSQFEFAPTIQIPPPTEQAMYIDHTYISIPGIK
jgi:glycosyltransferase involved in cell wall biosynthesis